MIAVATIVRNEASRWLPSTLKAWLSFADIVVALDDGSTDGTKELLAAEPDVMLSHRYADEPMWGQESSARLQLWELAMASGADWIFFLDADMVPAASPKMLFQAPVDAIAFRLYDLWSLHPPLYRSDTFWQGHNTPRVWAVRRPPRDFVATWLQRGIHCGHLPANWSGQRIMLAPPEYSLLHLAYSDHASRKQKAQQYADRCNQLGRFEWEHAKSILDPMPQVEPLPFPVQFPLSKADGTL